jgi:hypothetical protein
VISLIISHLGLNAFINHIFTNLGIFAHLTNQSSSDVVFVIDEVSFIKSLLRFSHHGPDVCWRDCHVHSNGLRVPVHILSGLLFSIRYGIYLKSNVLFGSVSISLIHVVSYSVAVLVFVSLPPVKEVSSGVISTVALIKVNRRPAVLIRVIL